MNGTNCCQDKLGKVKGPELDLKPYNWLKEKGGGPLLLSRIIMFDKLKLRFNWSRNYTVY